MTNTQVERGNDVYFAPIKAKISTPPVLAPSLNASPTPIPIPNPP